MRVFIGRVPFNDILRGQQQLAVSCLLVAAFFLVNIVILPVIEKRWLRDKPVVLVER